MPMARHLGVTHATAVGVVHGLERRGLLVRRPDPRDRRVTLLALTEEGKRVAARLERWLEELEGHLDGIEKIGRVWCP